MSDYKFKIEIDGNPVAAFSKLEFSDEKALTSIPELKLRPLIRLKFGPMTLDLKADVIPEGFPKGTVDVKDWWWEDEGEMCVELHDGRVFTFFGCYPISAKAEPDPNIVEIPLKVEELGETESDLTKWFRKVTGEK